MTKLIKKHGLGGFAESVDKSLDGLGTWGKLGVQMIDPTGITSWKDLGDSLKTFQKEGTLASAGELGLMTLGAIPMFGVFKSAAKLPGKLLRGTSKVADSAVVKILTNVDKEIPKQILSKLSPKQKQEAISIIQNKINTIVSDFSKTTSGKLTPEIEEAITKLNKKAEALGGKPINIEDINNSLLQVFSAKQGGLLKFGIGGKTFQHINAELFENTPEVLKLLEKYDLDYAQGLQRIEEKNAQLYKEYFEAHQLADQKNIGVEEAAKQLGYNPKVKTELSGAGRMPYLPYYPMTAADSVASGFLPRIGEYTHVPNKTKKDSIVEYLNTSYSEDQALPIITQEIIDNYAGKREVLKPKLNKKGIESETARKKRESAQRFKDELYQSNLSDISKPINIELRFRQATPLDITSLPKELQQYLKKLADNIEKQRQEAIDLGLNFYIPHFNKDTPLLSKSLKQTKVQSLDGLPVNVKLTPEIIAGILQGQLSQSKINSLNQVLNARRAAARELGTPLAQTTAYSAYTNRMYNLNGEYSIIPIDKSVINLYDSSGNWKPGRILEITDDSYTIRKFKPKEKPTKLIYKNKESAGNYNEAGNY